MKIVRQRRPKCHALAPGGMIDDQIGRVKQQAFLTVRLAVDPVSKHRPSTKGKLNSYLMFATGVEFHFQQRIRADRPDKTILQSGGFSGRAPADPSECVFGQGVCKLTGFGRMPVHPGLVSARDGVTAELHLQVGKSANIAGKNKQPGCVAIESMHQIDPAPGLSTIDLPFQLGDGGGPTFIPGGGGDEPNRLIKYQNMCIREYNILAGDTVSIGRITYGDLISCRGGQINRSDANAVEFNASISHHFSQRRDSCIRK